MQEEQKNCKIFKIFSKTKITPQKILIQLTAPLEKKLEKKILTRKGNKKSAKTYIINPKTNKKM